MVMSLERASRKWVNNTQTCNLAERTNIGGMSNDSKFLFLLSNLFVIQAAGMSQKGKRSHTPRVTTTDEQVRT